MRPTTRPTRRLLGTATALAALCVAAACSDATAPGDGPVERQLTPFYYYEGRPVRLAVDPTRLTAEVAGDAPTVVRGALAGRVTVDSLTAMSEAAAHWIVWLHQGTSVHAAVGAATALRAASGVAFASSAYRLDDGSLGCPVLLVNRLVVQFRDGASASEIDALDARLGLTRALDGSSFTTWLRYPVHSAYTPLDIAAYYDRHPLVEWADPDRVNCAVML